MGKVGAMGTQESKHPKPEPQKPSTAPPASIPAEPDGNTPVDPQQTQEDRDRLRPPDQP